MKYVLGMLNYSTLLLFGVFVSAAFLSIALTKKNIVVLAIFSMGSFVLQIISFAVIGYQLTEGLYPLITHLPLVLLFSLYFKRSISSGIFAVTSAYLCCQISKWLGLLALELIGNQWVVYGIRTITSIVLGVLIIRFIASSVAVILTKPTRMVFIFAILPVAYYLFDYIATVYTDLLYGGSQAVFEFLPFVLSVAYLIFSVVYFKEYEEKCEAEQYNRLMEMRQIQSVKEIEAIRRSEYEISLLRHDMRHFLGNILSYIKNGDSAKAETYIQEITAVTDRTAHRKFCENELVNTVLSSCESKMTEENIRFHVCVKIPKTLPCGDIDFTSILANGLENAIQAVSMLEAEKREITLDLHTNDNKLLLLIKNPYAQAPELVNGIPAARKPGHGLGTQSIKYTVEKLRGNCQFSLKDDSFLLRVVL